MTKLILNLIHYLTMVAGIDTLLATKSDLIQQRSELQEYISNVKAELQESINNVRSDLQESISGVRSELHESMSSIRSELHKSIKRIELRVEPLEGDMRLIK